MIYLIDANVLIDSKNRYYQFDRVSQYWEWLEFQAKKGFVKVPIDIYEEVAGGQDELAQWTKGRRSVLVLAEEVDIELVRRVVTEGYASDLNEDEVEKLGRDPFLIAYALADPEYRTVVTNEVNSNRQRANRSVPDVCKHFGLASCNQWAFGEALDFRTTWKS